MAVAGPTRDGICFPAYTDWTLTYRYRTAGHAPRVVACDVEICATAIIHLPEWHAAQRADEALRAKWMRFVTDLEEHEREHAVTAQAAAVSLERAVEALAPCCDEATLDARIEALLNATRRDAHQRDERIDAEQRFVIE